MKNNVKGSKIIVGVIGGTPIDCRFGMDALEKKGIRVYGIGISSNPKEQTEEQILNKEKLTKKVIKSIIKLEKKGVHSIIIYCNSLSGAVDLTFVRENVNVPVITPLDVYRKIASKVNKIVVIAANCKSTANIERTIMSENKNARVFGIANLDIVDDVENNVSPEEIIDKYSLAKISFGRADVIILGCTHFPYFAEALKKQVDIEVFDPCDEMIRMVMERKQLYTPCCN